MTEDAKKMPEPIIEPTMSVVALKTPSRRCSVSAMPYLTHALARLRQNRVMSGADARSIDAPKSRRRRDVRRGGARAPPQAHAHRPRLDGARHRRGHRRRHLLVHGIGGRRPWPAASPP